MTVTVTANHGDSHLPCPQASIFIDTSDNDCDHDSEKKTPYHKTEDKLNLHWFDLQDSVSTNLSRQIHVKKWLIITERTNYSAHEILCARIDPFMWCMQNAMHEVCHSHAERSMFVCVCVCVATSACVRVYGIHVYMFVCVCAWHAYT